MGGLASMVDWDGVSLSVRQWCTDLPILIRFMIGLSLFVLIPSLSKRLGLPGVVGLIMAGMLLGKSGLDFWPNEKPVLELFGEVGKLLVLFFAGMEVDLDEFFRKKGRSIGFGLATLLLPLAAGIGIGMAFGYGTNSAVLIGSLIASHTLLAFPLVQKLGLAGRESIMVTVGATILTDVIALLILAVCVSIHTTGFDPTTLLIQIVQVLLYAFIIVVVVAKLARKLLSERDFGSDFQLVVLLLIVTVSSLLAEVIHLEPIVGAFLAGLAVSKALRESPAKEHIESMGASLFLPAFFLMIGLTIDARAALRSVISDWPMVLALVFGLVGTKFLAAWLAGWGCKYSPAERLTMWSLSLPQVAATLAATLVAFNTFNADRQRLIDEPVVNAVLVLVLVTATLGPILTQRYARQIT